MSGIIAQNVLDNSGIIKAPAGGGAWNFIKKISASGAATTSFVDGSSDVVFDSTYKEYLFTFKDIHPSVNASDFMFQVSTNAGSSYGVSMQTSYVQTYHKEDGSAGNINFRSGSVNALANSTNFQSMSTADGVGTDNDQALCGFLQFYDPSNTTHVKHFLATDAYSYGSSYGSFSDRKGGYINTTTAIDGVQFKFASGNCDSGTFKLYGIKHS